MMSFTVNYLQTKNSIYNYFIYRVGFNKALAEDLTSETYLRALEHYQDFDQTRSYKAWIFTIAHNLLVNHYKKRKTESLEVLAESGFEPGDVDGGNKVSIGVEVNLVLDKIQKLEQPGRDIIMLHYVDQLPYREISEMVEESESNVRVIAHRLLKTLTE